MEKEGIKRERGERNQEIVTTVLENSTRKDLEGERGKTKEKLIKIQQYIR